MLKDALKARLGGDLLSLRVARARGADDAALFIARFAPDADARHVEAVLDALGMEAVPMGGMTILRAAPALTRALESLASGGCAAQDIAAACAPGSMCHEQAALLREFERLPKGIAPRHMPLIARGLRLAEGPATQQEKRAYIMTVRQEAARSLRAGTPGGALRACAYIIAMGGMKYEA
ncbi:MAG: hypothetical protein ACOYIH_01125 [Candidatus Fimadaptatus sp.]|jgi:hypothetical protein